MWFLQPRDEDRVRHVLMSWLKTHAPQRHPTDNDLVGLCIAADGSVAFAHGRWHIAGHSHAATFCLLKADGAWQVVHQHISDSVRTRYAEVQPRCALSVVR